MTVGYVRDVTEELSASIFTVEISIVFQDIKPIKEKEKISKTFLSLRRYLIKNGSDIMSRGLWRDGQRTLQAAEI